MSSCGCVLACAASLACVVLPVGCQSPRGLWPLAWQGAPDPETIAVDGWTPANQALQTVAFRPEDTEPVGEEVEAPLAKPQRLGASTIAGPRPVDTNSDRLTLATLEAVALASHPEIAEARQRVEVARGQAVQAGLPFNPVLQYQSEEIGNGGASGLHWLQLSQQMVTANKLGLAQQMQMQLVTRRQAELEIAQLRVLTRLRSSFALAMIAQERAELSRQIVDVSEQSVRSVQMLLDAQEVSRAELLQARVEMEQARIAAENAETLLQANRKALEAAVGVPDIVSEPVVGELAAGLTETPWDQLIEQITAASPQLQAADSDLQRARWALSLANAQVTPNVTGQIGVGIDDGTDDTFGIVGVSVPLPIRNRNQGNIRAARAQVAAASQAIDRTRWDLQTRLADAVGRYETARQRYQRLTENVLPAAEETFELSQTAFEAAELSYLNLLTSQRTLFRTRITILEALAQARQALAEIEGLLVTLP